MANENANRVEQIVEGNFENSNYFNSFFDTLSKLRQNKEVSVILYNLCW